MKKSILISVAFSLIGFMAYASKIIEVKPLTNKVLMVRFDDGYAIHHKNGEPRSNESVVLNKLDIIKAMLKASYSLQSADDANYTIAMNPFDIGRKSKPTEFALMCQTYNDGCINTDPDHALEHWVYVILPHALQSGKSYTLTLDNLAETGNTINFTFNESALHSEAIHVNNIGYATTAPAKYAYVYHWMGDKGSLDLTSFAGQSFKVFNTDNSQYVFTGTIVFRKSKTNVETGQSADTPGGNFSSADVYECDFSSFNTPGNYKIVIDGIGSSFPFIINEDAYQEAFYTTMKGLYQNRSGIALQAPYADFIRPAPHNVKVTPGFAGKLKYSTFRTFDRSSGEESAADKPKIEAGYKGILDDTYGWYQDAGDWDGYYTHTNIPSYLLFLYESGRAKFTDGELNIPESTNGIPDVLDEAVWLMRYFKRAKDEVKSRGWGTGGVPGARVFGDLWGSDAPNDITQGSWEDTERDWYVLGEDPWTSYKYAATAAQLAFILETDGKVDVEGVDWKQEAIDVYAWAKANTKPGDENPKFDVELKNIRLYAAAALFRLTGEDDYHNQFYNDIKDAAGYVDQGKQDQMFGVWMYLLAGNQVRETNVLNKVKQMVSNGADKYLTSTAEGRGARWGGDFYFPMLVGQGSTPMVTPGVYGYLLNKQNAIVGKNLLKSLHTTSDYFLGCNPLNMTWISGVAERHPVGLFHLDWWAFDKADPNNSLPVIKGVVPYGPWRYENQSPLGWWSSDWAYSDNAGNPRIYPVGATNWPGHERWFDMRVSPLSSEFTIHQNTVVAAFVYGFLTAGATTDIEEGVVTASENEVDEAESVVVFPNPAKESVVVRSLEKSMKQLEMFDMNGKRVAVVRNINKKEHVVELRGYDSGTYILKVYLNSKTVVERKLIVRQ